MKQNTTESTESKTRTPFFARKRPEAQLVVRTGLKAGAAEEACKSDDPKNCR